MKEQRIPVSPAWLDELKSGRKKFFVCETNPLYVELFTNCDKYETDAQVLYNNLVEYSKIVFYVPVLGGEYKASVDYYDICKGTQIGLNNTNLYFVVFLK